MQKILLFKSSFLYILERIIATFKVMMIIILILSFALYSLCILFFIWPFPHIAFLFKNHNKKIFSNVFLFILGVKIDIQGKFPVSPFLLVSNHLSYLDIIVYIKVINCHFLSKLEVASWPIIGKVAKLYDTIFINRTKKSDILRVIPLIIKKLQNKENVCLFPEGTTSNGKQIFNFHSPLYKSATESGVPVLVSSLSYHAYHPKLSVHNNVCWPTDTSFATHLFHLGRYKNIYVKIQINPELIFHSNYKTLSKLSQKKMLEIFIPSENEIDPKEK